MRWLFPKNIATLCALLAGMISLLQMNMGVVNAAENEIESATIHDTISVPQGYEDPQLRKLAEQLVNYSVDLKKDERILLWVYNETSVPLAKEIINEVYRVGGVPFVDMLDERLDRALYLGTTAERYQLKFSWDSLKYSSINAYIILDGTNNNNELSDVSAEKTNLESKYWGEPLWSKIISPKLKWCYLRTPSLGMAQAAGMSTEAFTDFYFKVCTMDYSKLSGAMEPLAQLMRATDKVHIIGPGTNMTFSIKNIPVVPCAGHFNVPDGELFTAPVKNSVNGTLTLNRPITWFGVTYQDMRLEFKDGKIIKASANYSDKLNQVLDVDEGARYLGEFSFGLNPYIEKPIGDILFDEKICMSFHLAVGNSYPDANNDNHSALHWDLISIQAPEYGGGEIWFDGKLIRKDGLFVVPELQGLNPENLK
jgi:aminopeptidase